MERPGQDREAADVVERQRYQPASLVVDAQSG